MKLKALLAILLFSSILSAQNKPAYQLFDAAGKAINYSQMLDSLRADKNIILFGELHNNPIAHWLELELTQDLAKTKSLVLGAEMLETDNQLPVNLYLKDSIDYTQLSTQARLWVNHKTDYQPLLDFAKANNLNFIATNIPRRYASLVYRESFKALDSLSATEKNWIAPLPIAFDPDLPRYREILTMMGEHGSPKLVMAQAIKDATMAHFILKNYREDQVFIHYNGSFHSDFHEGILWYLQRAKPDLNYSTIATVSQKSLDSLEEQYLNQADFILVVDEDMTKTH